MTEESKSNGTSVTAPTAIEDPDDHAYLEQVRREIDEEVRRRRAAGDFPPSFERKLDELFARFTPTGTHDDHFTDALKLADRSAYFDIQVPLGSRRRPQGFIKWVLWMMEAWFVNYVVRQINHFSASVMRVVHLLDERLGVVEREIEMMGSLSAAEDEAVTGGADTAPFADLLEKKLTAKTAPKGRVLHAECGDGSLVATFAASDIDAYGIDPGTAGADAAVKKGLDVRRDDVLGHLGSVGDEKLAGVVLSGCVDRMNPGDRRRLLELAEIKLAPGGTIALIVASPRSWQTKVGPVVADLAAGRPWHAETWGYLLSQFGFSEIGSFAGPSSDGFGRAETDDPVARVLNGALERLEPLVAGPEAYCLVGTKKPAAPKSGGR